MGTITVQRVRLHVSCKRAAVATRYRSCNTPHLLNNTVAIGSSKLVHFLKAGASMIANVLLGSWKDAEKVIGRLDIWKKNIESLEVTLETGTPK